MKNKVFVFLIILFLVIIAGCVPTSLVPEDGRAILVDKNGNHIKYVPARYKHLFGEGLYVLVIQNDRGEYVLWVP